jgi:hypothetical protein
MANQLWQVFRTYITSRIFWFWVGYWILMCVIACLNKNHTPTKPGSIFIPLFPSFMLGIMVGGHLKTQFSNPRARMLPDFAIAHLIVPGIIIAAMITLDAVIITWAWGCSFLTAAGFVLIMLAPIFWSVYLNQFIFSLLLQIPFFVLVFAPQYFIGTILIADPISASLLVFFGLAIFAALGMSLLKLNEDMPGYSHPTLGFNWDLTTKEGRRNRRQWDAQSINSSKFWGWLYDFEFRLAFRWLSDKAPFRRLLLNQLAEDFSCLFLALIMFLGITFIYSSSHNLRSALIDSFSLSFVAIVAMAVICGIWLRRWPYLSRELLLPVSRKDFVRDIVRSNAFDMAAIACAQVAGIILGTLLSGSDKPFIGFVLPHIAMVIAQYAILCFLILWLVAYRRYLLVAVVNLVGIIILVALISAAIYSGEIIKWMIALGIVVVTSTIYYQLAFRRWYNIELD